MSVFQVERRFHIGAGVAAALVAGILAVPVAAGSASAAGTPPGSPSRQNHPHHRVSSTSPTRDHPGFTALAEDQMVVKTLVAAAESVLPEKYGFTAGSHQQVTERYRALEENQALSVIAAKVRGGVFEEAELFLPSTRGAGIEYTSSRRTVSYENLANEGSYNLFYKVHTFDNDQAMGGSSPDRPGPLSPTAQQHIPQPLSPAAQRILGKMKADSIKAEVFTFLNTYPERDFSLHEIFRGTIKAKNPESINDNLNKMVAEGIVKRTAKSVNTGSGGIPARYQALREDEHGSHSTDNN